MMQAKPTVPVNCLFQGCYNPEFEAEIRKCKDKCHEYNQLNPNDRGTDVKKSEGGPGRGYYLNGKFYSYTDDEKSEQ